MKPKTIQEAIIMLCEECDGKGYNEFGGMAMEDGLVEKEPCTNELHERLPTALAQIQQLLEECAPEKKPPCGTGTISDDNQEWWCDLDKGFNQAVDQYKSNIRERIK